MTLAELLAEIEKLNDRDFQRLQEFVEERRRQQVVRDFDAAIAALQEGLSEEEVASIKQALNQDYIEEPDTDQWRE